MPFIMRWLNFTNANVSLSPHTIRNSNAASVHSASFLRKQSCSSLFLARPTQTGLNIKFISHPNKCTIHPCLHPHFWYAISVLISRGTMHPMNWIKHSGLQSGNTFVIFQFMGYRMVKSSVYGISNVNFMYFSIVTCHWFFRFTVRQYLNILTRHIWYNYWCPVDAKS